jgi:hypothetical protein
VAEATLFVILYNLLSCGPSGTPVPTIKTTLLLPPFRVANLKESQRKTFQGKFSLALSFSKESAKNLFSKLTTLTFSNRSRMAF